MTEEDLKAVEERAARANARINELAKDGRRLRMCIPAQADDDDLLLSQVSSDATSLVAEVRATRARAARALTAIATAARRLQALGDVEAAKAVRLLAVGDRQGPG